MNLRAFLLHTCLLLSIVLGKPVFADEFWLSGNENGVALPAYHDMLEDKSGALRPEDLADAERAGRFIKVDRTPLNLGYSKSAFWLRAVLVNPTKKEISPWLEVGSPRLQKVSLYLLRQGRWQHFEGGSGQPFDLRPVKYRQSVFPFRLAPGESITAYIRIASETSISVETRLWSESSFRAAEAQSALSNGLQLGGLGALALCGLILFYSFGQRSFLFHALGLLAYLLYEMGAKGYSFMLLWPNSPIWGSHSLAVFSTAASIARIFFMREFLQTRHTLRRWDPLLLLAIYLQLAAVAYSQFIDYRQGANACVALGIVSLLGTTALSVLALARGLENAGFYLGATLILISGAAGRYLDFLGLNVPTLLSEYAPPISAILAAMLLLAAMIEALIRNQRKTEAEQNRILSAKEAQRQQLEQAVQLRTKELHDALRQAESANQAKSTLLAHISHDLRAPLATIIGHVRLLRRQAGLRDARHPIAIENSAQRQLALIDELLEYAQSGYRGVTLAAQPSDLRAFLKEVAEEAAVLAIQQHNRFVLQTDDQLPAAVVADLKRLHQVLMNLLSNAAKFTCDGEIMLEVQSEHTVPEVPGRVWLCFQVSDTGAGIGEDDGDRIFEPFQRGAAATGKQGVGLGLSIARLIVSSMGGQLMVSSVLGQGSRFYFRLPFELASESEVQPLPKDGLGAAMDEEEPASLLIPASGATPDPGAEKALPAALSVPPLRMAQLLRFVEDGAVTEIEEWVATIKRDIPESANYTAQIEQALKALDFNVLEKLAASK